jgi:hypothetical protein
MLDRPGWSLAQNPVPPKSYAKLLRRLCHKLSVVKKDFCRGKAVRLQDELVLEILNLIQRMAVTVLAWFAVGDASGLRSVL